MDSFTRLEYVLAEQIKRQPLLWFLILKLVNRLPFLLPHDRSYLGLKHLIKHCGGMILDVGANNGMSALGFRAVGLQGEILSIEGSPYHTPELDRVKSRIQNFSYRIVGAGDRVCTEKLITGFYKFIPLHGASSTNFAYLKKTLERDFSKKVMSRVKYVEELIHVIPLDSLNLDVTLIKIDVEGYDHVVLKGLMETIERCRPVLLIEFTPGFYDETEKFLDKLSYIKLLYDVASNRFRSFDLNEATQLHSSNGLQVNIFAMPESVGKTLPGYVT